MTGKETFPPLLMLDDISDRDMKFRNALFSLDEKLVTQDTFHYLVNIYNRSKLEEVRYRILISLYDKDYPALQEFFAIVFKKQRDLAMKILALRGLAQFITEAEVAKLLQHFNKLLANVPTHTPCWYIGYEQLRGKNSLAYLVEKYGYACFRESLDQVNRQYHDMPDAFKGIFTVNEKGESIRLMSNEESSKRMQDYFKQSGFR